MRVAVMGLGYVGLPLCIEFGRGGVQVIGIDVLQSKVAQINAGRSYVLDVPDASVKELVDAGRFSATMDFSVLRDCDAVAICVPTPLRKSQDPDMSYIVSAVDEVAKHLHQGMLVVLQSTTYPGTTVELLLPRLEETGLKVGVDFFLAFSPERVDPGNAYYTVRNTPKVVGGITPECTRRAIELYHHAVDTVVPVSSAIVGEMVKLLENTFRAINIGLVNELAIMCGHLGIDVWEVINAAKTKPFGFMPFYPGPGLGGHCIPIDPLYLSWKLKTINYTARFIELANSINASMPAYVATKIADILNDDEKSVRGSRILVLGVAYKPDVNDTRESPAIDVIGLLQQRGAKVDYADPYVPELHVPSGVMKAYDLAKGISEFDCIVIITNHKAFDYAALLREAKIIYDTRNSTAGLDIPPTCRRILL